MQYTTQELVEAYLQRSLNVSEITILTMIIDHISLGISTYTNRFWIGIDDDEPETEAEERLYDGNGNQEIYIDDFSDLEKVEILDSLGGVSLTLEDESEWLLYPLNSDIKESVRLRSYIFPEGAARVSITAVFGSGELPEAVKSVATTLVSKFLVSAPVTTGFKSESIEGYSYSVFSGVDKDEETKLLLVSLDHYKKVSLL